MKNGGQKVGGEEFWKSYEAESLVRSTAGWMAHQQWATVMYRPVNPASILQHWFSSSQVYLMKICPMTLSFHLPHNTAKCQRAREGRTRGKKSRGGVSTGNMTCGPEEVKQRKSEAERERERWRETSHVQSHSPLGCTRKHTPSIIWLQLTHMDRQSHTHVWDTF